MKCIPAAFLSIAVAGCAGMSGSQPVAVATLQPTQGNGTKGTVTFVQKGDQLMIDARVSGLTPGMHGFHIHEKGDCSAPDASSAGEHFNPTGKKHGGPMDTDHHGGDFGNLTADESSAASLQLSVPTSQINITKSAANSIVGKGLIVHADPDDYKSQPSGNAGKRLACGVIALQ